MMKIDLHCHTKYSGDNFFEPESLVAEAYAAGLDGICVTEHHSLDASIPVKKISLPDNFLLLRGIEVSTNIGHMLAFGLEDDSWNSWGPRLYVDCRKAVKAIKERGGICIPSHPYRGLESMGDRAFQPRLFDAVESFNGANRRDQNIKARKKAVSAEMNEIGGSDCHGSGEVGRAYTVFEKEIRSIKDLVNEIKAGRVQPAMGF